MIEFSRAYILWFLILLPFFLLGYYVYHKNRRDKIFKVFNPEMYGRLALSGAKKIRRVHFLLEWMALSFLILALAGPRIGTEIRELKREGVDIIVALDLSRSMTAEDIAPNRLTRAKFEVKKFINQLKGDRIGLVGFAGIAHLQCPLTLDHSAASMLLDVMDETLLPVQGTALAEAIDIAVKSFPEESGKHKALVIISDGEDHEASVEKASENARDKGITIYTIGVGTLKGAPIPIYNKQGQISDYKRSAGNQIVTTQLQEYSLEKIAEISGGMYLRAYETKDPLKKLYASIMNMERKEFKTHDFSQYTELYQFFIIIALVLLFVEMLLPNSLKRDNETDEKVKK